jgi:hypothetical protein
MGFLTGIAGGLLVHQAVGVANRFHESAEKYTMAQEEAKIRGKPLLVVGGPYGVADPYITHPALYMFVGVKQLFGIKAHGCGDLCVDLDARACDGCPYQPGNIQDLPFKDKEFGAVSCSHVLEHMRDAEGCQKAWSELHRVADVVFICVPPKSSIFAWFVPDHHLWVRHVGETVLEVEERDNGNKYLVDPYGPPQLHGGG